VVARLLRVAAAFKLSSDLPESKPEFNHLCSNPAFSSTSTRLGVVVASPSSWPSRLTCRLAWRKSHCCVFVCAWWGPTPRGQYRTERIGREDKIM
jgi:hypothetical protein